MKKTTVIFLSFFLFISYVFSKGTLESSYNNSERIISLAPNITEIIFALNMDDKLIGRTNVCDYPAQALNIEDVGEMYNPSIEKIISLKPGIVICTGLTSSETIKSLNNAGIRTEVLDYQNSLDGTYELIKSVGKIINKWEEANEIVLNMKDEVGKIVNIVSKIDEKDKKSCIYMVSWGQSGDFCATGDTYLGDIIEIAGGINVAKASSNWSISKEVLLKANPSVIFLSYYSYMTSDINNFKNTYPYNMLSGEVIKIDGQRAERQGIRTVQTIKEMAYSLYPDLFR